MSADISVPEMLEELKNVGNLLMIVSVHNPIQVIDFTPCSKYAQKDAHVEKQVLPLVLFATLP